MKLRRSSAAGALILAAGLFLVGCSTTSTLNDTELQDQIAAQLAEQVGGEWTVACPDDQPMKKGGTFTCEVSSADGQSAVINVTQDDDEGNISWETTEG